MANSSTTALRYLLDFTRADIQEFEDVSRARLIVATLAAQAGQYPRRKRLVIHELEKIRSGKRWAKRWTWLPEIEKALPGGADMFGSRKQLQELQTTLNKRLAELFPVDGFGDLPGGDFYLPVSIKKLHLQRQNVGDAAPVEVRFVAKSWKDAFWLSVTALVEEFGGKLRRCQECKAVYLRTGRQSYCRDQCARRARNRRYTAKAGRRKK
jgi:hypothetical protein